MLIQYLLQAVFLAYLVFTGRLLMEVLVVFFKFQRSWRTWILGSFLSLTLTGSFCGAAVIFLSLSYLILAIILVLTTMIFLLTYLWARRGDIPDLPDSKYVKVIPEKDESESFGIKLSEVIISGAYLILAGFGFYLLYHSRSDASITSPWQVIDKNYIYVFALATAVLFSLLMIRAKSSLIIFLCIVHTFLLTSYLPLTHRFFYGGDAWRHMATEQRILDGKGIIEPVITDKNEIMNLSVLVGKLAYSQVWGISVLLGKIGIDLMTVNKWLMPIVWSLVFPILLFKIGNALKLSKRFSILFIFFSFLPFAWQASGSFTLPSNYGFLVWLFFVLLMFKRGNDTQPEQKYFLFFAGVSLIFGYTLYTLLFWVGWLLFEVIHQKGDFSYLEVILIVLGVSAILPLCEWYFGYSSLIPQGSFLEGFKQFFGNFMAYYLATGPRPHDIATGNVIFNQTPLYSFVPNLFTSNLWFTFVFMLFFWLVIIYGLWVSFYKGFGSLSALPGTYNERTERTNICWAMSVSIGLYLGYIVSRYWLPGQHLLTRRLDAVLAFLFITLLMLGLSHLPHKFRTWPIFILGLLYLIYGVSASYSLGPDTNVVSVDEYNAMRYVWLKEEGRKNHCVIAKVFPLLSLEAISDKSIIGGGFPIDSNFGQTGLSNILMNAKNSSVSILDIYNSFDQTGTTKCWVLTEQNESISYFIKQSSTEKNFNTVNIWEYGN